MADTLHQATAPRQFAVIEDPVARTPAASHHREIRPTGTSRQFGGLTILDGERVRVRADGTVVPGKIAHSSYLCANCDARFTAGAQLRPFCSIGCKSQAKTVRAFRAAFATYGRLSLPADVEQGLRIKLAHALAGGYDSTARYLSTAARQSIIERDGGQCQMCHSPGDKIDLIDGASSDHSNLRLLCHSCHAGVTMSHHRHIDPRTEPEIDALFDQLTTRIDASTPTRPCDAADWPPTWRSWTLQHAEF